MRAALKVPHLPLNNQCVLATGPSAERQAVHFDCADAQEKLYDFSILMPLVRPRRLHVWPERLDDGGFVVEPGKGIKPPLEEVVEVGLNEMVVFHGSLCHAGAAGEPDQPINNLVCFARTGPTRSTFGRCGEGL